MKTTLIIIAAVIALALFGVAAYVLRPPEQASAPIQATPIATQAQIVPTPTAQIETQPTLEPAATDVPTQSPNPTTEMTGSETGAYPSGTVTYQIVQAESQARFSIDEVLRGKPFTAVGATSQVAGEIAVNFDNLGAQVGIIQVNARTLKTDNNFRDRAINNEILDTAQYEYITFEPTAVTGLPASVNANQEFSFQITGSLTIRDITKEVTFEVRLTPISADRMQGYASATVLRSDYKLTIPSVPSVADVSDQVLLEIDFVAVRK
ncbi:MAG: YceI family protein [Chloroflexota bacterium]